MSRLGLGRHTTYLVTSLGRQGLRRSCRAAGHRGTVVGDGLLAFGYVAHDRTAGKLLVDMALGLGSGASLDGLSLTSELLLSLVDLGNLARLDCVCNEDLWV